MDHLAVVRAADSETSTTATVTTANLLTHLFRHPPEIAGKVLQYLDITDLLALRQTDHALHALVHEHEASLCASYCRSLECLDRAFSLPARVFGIRRDLIFFRDLQQRQNNMRRLSVLLSDHFISHLERHNVTEKESIEDMRSKARPILHKALFPALFLLNSFFECLRDVVVDAEKAFQDWDDEEYVAAVDVFMLDQQTIIEELCHPSQVIDLLAAWNIVQTACSALKLRFAWKAPTYPFPTIKRLLLYCGLSMFTEILSTSQDVSLRRGLMSKFSDRIWKPRPLRRHSLPLLASIEHLAIDRHAMYELSDQRPYRVVNAFVEGQKLVAPAAFAVLQRKGWAEDLDMRCSPGRWIISKLRNGNEESTDYTFSDFTRPVP